MARVKLILLSRESKRNKDGLYPIALKIFHKKARYIGLKRYTSISGWDDKRGALLKSCPLNKHMDCDSINIKLSEKLLKAKKVVQEIGDSIDLIDVDRLVGHVKKVLDDNPGSELKKKVENEVSLYDWGQLLIRRKLKANKPGTAQWYNSGIEAILRFNDGKDIMLYDINVTFLKEFEAHHDNLGNSKNTQSAYLRALRVIYNNAVQEDVFRPIKNVFDSYPVPTGGRTKKRALDKNSIMNIKSLKYKKGSALWHTKNYAMIMFYCRGMNFRDLVQIRAGDLVDGRLYYGRSKTGGRFSVKIVPQLRNILDHYLADKKSGDYLFPANYDGSSEHYQKYKSQIRRMNQRLKTIAHDAGIKGPFTTYYIRHSWATIAKYMGISTALISEGLGHSSIKTTEIYLKDFEDRVLDEANEKIVA
ncbi:MAG: site-specific integrase [Bacteroidota bacterium]